MIANPLTVPAVRPDAEQSHALALRLLNATLWMRSRGLERLDRETYNAALCRARTLVQETQRAIGEEL